ncbi:formate dehydrogenase accessory sulfurtransferase FdhD [Paracoccus sp. Z330]|uniref:Sulfur carrier protein FdhD n=1 Tax=Paracoccus onchidii TaxID=3017813 RepID=A0ABT4ZFS9_9RHOB|nr:formate dehydrogenase accessory sulfurtransferase FdhD [Paracoccus onchidii]MDB6177962.1 formate dehydrogenase accessory sulfurtransferase FdhD [Paracoccus onchidii]
MTRRPNSLAVSCRQPSDAMGLPDRSAPVVASHIRHGSRRDLRRVLPEETAVALVYDGTSHAVMMATPADLDDFAVGFSLSEGVIDDPSQIESRQVMPHRQGVEVQMWLTRSRGDVLAARRRSMAGPVGCGLCGIDSLEQAMRDMPDLSHVGPVFSVDQVASATGQLQEWQPLHDSTRAVHAAGFLHPEKGILLAREDVGRHNALDKLIGAMARQGLDPAGGAIVLTSRVSVEMVQKCAMAGCAMLIAVSGPTLTALRVADRSGITVAAFARGEGFDLFTHSRRLNSEVPDVA